MAKDVKMDYFEDDIQKIQNKTNLYIKNYGPAGAFHLFKEDAQNAIDECIDEDSNGNEINIKLDLTTDKVTVEDNGRGFPEVDFPLDIFCTKIQSGSKFYRDQSGGTSGEFGLGLTAINALSSFFMIESRRAKEKTIHRLTFKEGKKIKDEVFKNPSKKHGSTVSFIPSRKYLGDNTVLPVEDITNWLTKMSYLLPKKRPIVINYEVMKGLEPVDSIVFKQRDFDELLPNIVTGNKMSKKVSLNTKATIDEIIGGKVKTKVLNLQFAFMYDDSSESVYDSYCNFTNTTENGVHVDAVEECLCRFFTVKTRASLSEREKEKYDILWNDVRAGLKMILNLNTNAQVGFEGNMKEKIGNKLLFPVIKEAVTPLITNYFEEHDDELKNIIKIVKLNARARIEANKVKTKIVAESVGRFNDHEIPNYRRAYGGKNVSKEIFLIEGERSALGSAVDAADRTFQGFYGLKGQTKNVIKGDISKIMNPQTGNKEWVGYVKALGCGWGKNCDPSKCVYDRIIFMTDADVDGYGITEGAIAFHLYALTPLVEAGMLYKVLPPLYSIGKSQKKLTYARNKDELAEIYYKNIAANIKIQRYGNPKFMNKQEVKQFLVDTNTYSENLVHIAKHYGIDKFLLERIIAYLVKTIPGIDMNTDVEKYMGTLVFKTNLIAFVQEQFPEVTLVGKDSLRGIVNHHEQSIQITNRLVHMASELFDVIRLYDYVIKVVEGDLEPQYLSIGQFLDLSMKYTPRIYVRYKGLGEMSSGQLWDTTMNPDTRVLVHLTTQDLERELAVFQMMNGGRAKDREDRKKIMRGYKIRREDLDN